jgi:hypothetical protein
MAILQITDFASGVYKIPVKTTLDASLLAMIDKVESEYLVKLMGVELYDLFVADLAGTPSVPVSARFLQIFNAFNDQTDDCLTQSDGMIEMLKGLVYYLYVRDNVTRLTTTGVKVTTGENSDNVTAIGHDITTRYNNAIENYKVIQNYMLIVDPDTYPEFAGVAQQYNHIY